MKCKICNNTADLFGEAKILCKYHASFYRCSQCGFMQTETPYWLDDAYSNIMTKSDIGLIGRNLEMANVAKTFILTCLNPRERFIDYGGGYGMFVRLMRDAGFDFYRYDPLCENLFSESFDAQSGLQYSLLTAWEVFEHFTDPLVEIEKMLSFSKTIFFSTLLLPLPPKSLNNWWYYGLEHGQHVAFYSTETLQAISKKFNLKLYYSNGVFHLLSREKINPLLVQIAFNPSYRLLRRSFAKQQPASLLEQDYQKITGKKLQ